MGRKYHPGEGENEVEKMWIQHKEALSDSTTPGKPDQLVSLPSTPLHQSLRGLS